ncbi:MAG: sodium-translocating pyrophosphatase [Omnitrophica bacterium RIFCSPLOWO2_12_FULL_44_17]|uniref:K(+)-insensitive pyrophosphate-energized proton pump n=1 Tax=Candidatus Danuiimicrobium aquiferis TaxID=1801832 RepID=A0A1G1L1R2_9BACT|nr:MAG: sodium-translocating pyrophosphatase [Omnitrophica bacterium RIFCSPHIGHO2_02_FULL_45_28]OGW98829.1 MAG: sodium-translocating pyrophosphatase [Omnitrophica bacterium RIFCSPLOWO2_12_FULL_44_17]OGX02789.1 MAG: sodium-translocating pyrophosphatase [Omnitrophica bacterium RIFCSPLOWO2_02_FULL_44_11]
MKKTFSRLLFFAVLCMGQGAAWSSEADLKIPDLHQGSFNLFGGLTGFQILLYGAMVILGTMGLSLYQFVKVKAFPAHKSMLDVAETIFQTCKTYLKQQAKFLTILFAIIACAMAYYFIALKHESITTLGLVLLFSVVGMAGSVLVAFYGIRINTYANARTAFASLRGIPWEVVNIPMRAGMSVGLFLISIELVMMVSILLFVPRDIVGYCFLGFAIGESLGASALRIAGGIFTKIADIGSDLMKIVFQVKEDDPRNPGVIADCAGDNAGDSVGPTADGFETYGVTGVALISFITLAVKDPTLQAKLIVWIFAMRFLMDFMSGVSYFINKAISERKYKNLKEFNFEEPLTRLIQIATVLCISTSYGMSYLLVGDLPDPTLWWKLASIIACGTLAAFLIPEFTKVFTSSHSKHVKEIVTASREGGASLTILSGLVAGYFSAFWKGILIATLMFAAYLISGMGLQEIMPHASVFAFGLVAYGFLCMGPVNIAVDSYGPVTDNAQSIFELAQTESIPGIAQEIEKDFGFKPDFKGGKHYLEANDSAGNTFKATAKPVLIGTAVAGATTMIFSIILILQEHLHAGAVLAAAGAFVPANIGEMLLNAKLSLTAAPILLGFLCGGAVIFWFCGASIQAVTTGAYSAVEYIKKNMNLDKKVAEREDSIKVVKICTEYAQKGMWNIFLGLLTLTLAFALFDPYFFIAYLIAIAVFGLFQAMYMANAGGAWDNAKKIVEVDLGEKNTPVHAATVIGDTVGDPFKDTTSVSLNPIIKFSTLFGMLAVEIAIKMNPATTRISGAVLLLAGLFFVWKSFYKMRIPEKVKAS